VSGECNIRRKIILNTNVFVVRSWGEQYIEELIVNITVVVVRVWELLYREEILRNITALVVSFWEGKYREELILNVSCCEVLRRAIWRGKDTECYCICFNFLWRAI